jgi:hypothetical protein
MLSSMVRLIVACPCLGQLALTCLSGSLLHLSAWAKSDERDAAKHALSILGTMEETGLQPDVVTYTAVINGTFDCRLSMPRAACAYLFVGFTSAFVSLGEV